MKRAGVVLLYLVGFGLVTAAAWLVAPPVGLLIAGLCMLAIAVTVDGERPGRRL